jgi:hypothetical protein
MHGLAKNKKWQRNPIYRVWITKAIRQGARFKSLQGYFVFIFWNLKRVGYL